MSCNPRVGVDDEYMSAPGGPLVATVARYLSADLTARRSEFSASLNGGLVDSRTKEMLRIYNASMSDCEFCKNVRYAPGGTRILDEDAVEAVRHFESMALGPAHTAALQLAAAYFSDPPAASDDVMSDVQREYSDAQIVELLLALLRARSGSTALIALGLEPEAMEVRSI